MNSSNNTWQNSYSKSKVTKFKSAIHQNKLCKFNHIPHNSLLLSSYKIHLNSMGKQTKPCYLILALLHLPAAFLWNPKYDVRVPPATQLQLTMKFIANKEQGNMGFVISDFPNLSLQFKGMQAWTNSKPWGDEIKFLSDTIPVFYNEIKSSREGFDELLVCHHLYFTLQAPWLRISALPRTQHCPKYGAAQAKLQLPFWEREEKEKSSQTPQTHKSPSTDKAVLWQQRFAVKRQPTHLFI